MKFDKPSHVSDLDVAFPATVKHLMPSMDSIPQEFHNGSTKWNNLVSAWFFKGLTKLDMSPKDGIEKSDAMRHIKAIMGSFEPKHEHKEAACAYLLSKWFEDATWEVNQRSR